MQHAKGGPKGRIATRMVDRNGRIAIRYATRTMKLKPNIARMAVKLGDVSSTNTAGSSVISARIFVPIQSSIGYLRRVPTAIALLAGSIFVKGPSLRRESGGPAMRLPRRA